MTNGDSRLRFARRTGVACHRRGLTAGARHSDLLAWRSDRPQHRRHCALSAVSRSLGRLGSPLLARVSHTLDRSAPSCQPEPAAPALSARPLPGPGASALLDPVRGERDAGLAQWLLAAADGNTSAFEAFYEATLPQARALARRMVRPDELDDLLADAYFQAWREAARFDRERGSAMSWLLLIVRSRALDLLRRQRHSAEQSPPDLAPEPVDEAPGPDALLQAVQAGSQLHAALAQLSAPERWVLGLAFFRDLSHSEIAASTGLALGTVKSHLRRAQDKLRAQLSPAGGECS